MPSPLSGSAFSAAPFATPAAPHRASPARPVPFGVRVRAPLSRPPSHTPWHHALPLSALSLSALSLSLSPRLAPLRVLPAPTLQTLASSRAGRPRGRHRLGGARLLHVPRVRAAGRDVAHQEHAGWRLQLHRPKRHDQSDMCVVERCDMYMCVVVERVTPRSVCSGSRQRIDPRSLNLPCRPVERVAPHCES